MQRVYEDVEARGQPLIKRREIILVQKESQRFNLLRYVHLLPSTCGYVELQSWCIA
jgi:hypothetical protein